MVLLNKRPHIHLTWLLFPFSIWFMMANKIPNCCQCCKTFFFLLHWRKCSVTLSVCPWQEWWEGLSNFWLCQMDLMKSIFCIFSSKWHFDKHLANSLVLTVTFFGYFSLLANERFIFNSNIFWGSTFFLTSFARKEVVKGFYCLTWWS